MELPEFKPSKRFLHDTTLPCLVAKVKNSKLPGVAAQHITQFKDDPTCKIVFRGHDPTKISSWQREMLEQLLQKNGLGNAVEEAMKEYETSPEWGGDFCANLENEMRQKVKEQGMAAFITIYVIVIDEIERKVLISAGTTYDGNLDEHGITIYSSEGRWRFDNADYFIHYESDIHEAQESKKAEKWHKKWAAVFPLPEPATPVEANGSILYGVWRYIKAKQFER